jgi:predicted Rossmann-fold nucleotide-binding protein
LELGLVAFGTQDELLTRMTQMQLNKVGVELPARGADLDRDAD